MARNLREDWVLLLLGLTAGWASGAYLGCYEDAGNRLLSDYRMDLNDINNPSKCIYICMQLGYRYAGVENGNQCFCSYQRPGNEKKKNENDCQSSCPKSNEKCGGFWRLAVYSIDSYSPSSIGLNDNGTYIGCYEDTGKRLLSDFRIDFSEINTPKKCLHMCRTLGFKFAGVENGNECFCSKRKPGNAKKMSENDCQSSCPHSQEKCGGSWRLSVYTYPMDSASKTDVSDEMVNRMYLGCFEDNGNRLLSDFRINLNDINSPKKCIHVCQQLGYMYAGVENGNECFCGNQTPSEDKQKSKNDCRSSCPNSKKKCGGSWHISVYTIESTLTETEKAWIMECLCKITRSHRHSTGIVENDGQHIRFHLNFIANMAIEDSPFVDVWIITARDETLSRAHLGCFEDNRKRLLSEYRVNLDDINSPKKCINVCQKLSYKYAGVENGNECFCGNQRPGDDKRRSENDCRYSCPNSKEKCGGYWRISVYTTETTPLVETAEWASGGYLGCFEDAGNRLLSDYRMDLNDINSPSKCIYICTQLEYRYAGLESGNQCFCGNQRPTEDKKKNENDCQSSCPNSNEKCGGSWRLAVHTAVSYPSAVIGSENNGTYIGCYEDAGKRLLSDFRIDFSEINSPRKCLHLCRTLRFQFAGVENGNECFCSKNKPVEDKKKSNNDCRSSCPHSQEKCGGSWRLAVYSYPLDPVSDIDISDETVSRSHLGCFEDNGKRLLSDYRINLNDINSPKRCLHICQQLGYKYAGVENGNDCFCGNQTPSEDKKMSENDCQSSCPNSQEKCGGSWRLSVYATESSLIDVRLGNCEGCQ